MGLAEEFAGDFSELAASFGASGVASHVVFSGKTADCTLTQLVTSQEMQMAGIQMDADEQLTMLATDFTRLGASYEDEVSVSGKTLRIKLISFNSPLAIVGLKATR